MSNRIKPGNIFASDVAGCNDGAVDVGVVISTSSDDTVARALVFGRVPDNSGTRLRQFPVHKNFKRKDIREYDFSIERNFYRQSPCPEDSLSLVDVDIAQHLLAEGTIEDYTGWPGSICNENFLLLQAMLHGHFPGRVKIPPKEIELGNVILRMYYTGYGIPYVVTMFRREEGDGDDYR